MQTVYEKLQKIREKDDLALPHPTYMASSITKRDGSIIPFTLRGYQTQMVVHLLAMKRFVVGDDTGLGKTVEAIVAMCHLWERDPELKAVILTKKSSVPQWASEFARFTQGVEVLVAKGPPPKRAAIHEAWENSTGPTVLIQGYSSACNDFSRIQHWEGHVLVTDEATVYKTPTTRVHKVCRHLAAQADRCWALTATLIKNSLMEGYGIYKVVVPDLFRMSKHAFMQNFCILRMQTVARGRQIPVIVGYRDQDVSRFRDQIDPYYLGRPKHQVAHELPVLTTRDVYVGLSKFQKEKYREALDGLLGHGDGEDRETTQLTALIYCQEIVNHPSLIGFGDSSSEKMDALEALLSEGGDLEGEKVIVFTRFRKMVDVAIPLLEKNGSKCVRVTGDEGEDERKAAMDAFQDPSSDTNVIFITMAGGDAINLQAAKALIFYDTPWSAGDYLQVLGRMIRIGSDHDRVYAFHLICEDTVDERVQVVLRKKMGLIEAVLGERLRGEKATGKVYSVGSDVKDLYDALVMDAIGRPE